jgi:predicted cation transporter
MLEQCSCCSIGVYYTLEELKKNSIGLQVSHSYKTGMLDIMQAKIGLIVIFLAVLVLPFKVRAIERNLEIFLFISGVLALTISGFLPLPGEQTGWSWKILTESLTAPLNITNFQGIPIGIVQIVLLVGIIIYVWYRQIELAIVNLVKKFSVSMIVFGLIITLGLISSVISAILAAILLVEIICALPLDRSSKIDITVVACFAIGLGAALTPLGEPLSTIVVAKLSGAPHYAGFDFLFRILGIYIIPAVILLGIIGVILYKRGSAGTGASECHLQRETIRQVVVRSGKVYLFIMALVFLGEGFKPVVLDYVIQIPAEGLYWVNMVSAVLDNATLAAAEIGPALSVQQIKSAIMGLIIAGGMLIPGNIPNIIAAGKLEITSKEWARRGVPLGLVLMVCFFGILFIPQYLGLA